MLIGEVAERSGVSARMLRHYDSLGLVSPSERTSGGYRSYSEADLDLFALRALANRPLPRLTEISPDPVEAWRRGDSEVVRALAALELRSIGLRPVHGPDGEVRAR